MDVRVKLHIHNKSTNDYDDNSYLDNIEQNVWMSVNYEHQPTVKDIINKIRKHLNNANANLHLYLDNYWLPVWESSRIIRENDSIKVVVDEKNQFNDVGNKMVPVKPQSQQPVKELNRESQKSQKQVEQKSEPQQQQPLAKANNKEINLNINENVQKLTNKPKINENNKLIDNICKNLQTTGKNKWKNSNQPDSNKKPQHIIFKSSSDSSSDSASTTSSSSSSSSDEEVIEQPPQPQLQQRQTANKNGKKQQAKNKAKNQQAGNTFNNNGVKTKQDQIDMVSYNRSYYTDAKQDMKELKKVFNNTKYNSPKIAENAEVEKPNNYDEQQEQQQDEKFEIIDEPVDYEKYELVVGAPNINDKIAFQILEISSNFTPELSAYKTGEVIDYDINSGEITLKLDTVYNEVLQKPNKFTIIEDNGNEDEDYNEEYTEEDNGEPKSPEKQQQQEADDSDKILQVDWKSLINIRKIPAILNDSLNTSNVSNQKTE